MHLATNNLPVCSEVKIYFCLVLKGDRELSFPFQLTLLFPFIKPNFLGVLETLLNFYLALNLLLYKLFGESVNSQQERADLAHAISLMTELGEAKRRSVETSEETDSKWSLSFEQIKEYNRDQILFLIFYKIFMFPVKQYKPFK